MLLLTGEYQHVVDNKSRVLISNKLRNQIDVDEHGSNFYLVLGANGILCLYPEKYFEQIALAVTPGTTAPDEAVVFERISFAMSSKVELDGQGRLLLNEILRKRAGLKDQITLIGVRDHIELWNTENWEQYVSDHMAQYQKQMSQARQVVLLKQNEELWLLEWRQDRMIGTDSNHCRIVAESLAGKRKVDEHTFASLAILDERLEQLRSLGETFSGVVFSPDAAKLLSQKNAVAVGWLSMEAWCLVFARHEDIFTLSGVEGWVQVSPRSTGTRQ